MVDGVGGNSERGLKWDSGVTEEFFKKHLETGSGVGKINTDIVRMGEGLQGVSPPIPLPSNFNRILYRSLDLLAPLENIFQINFLCHRLMNF